MEAFADSVLGPEERKLGGVDDAGADAEGEGDGAEEAAFWRLDGIFVTFISLK